MHPPAKPINSISNSPSVFALTKPYLVENVSTGSISYSAEDFRVGALHFSWPVDIAGTFEMVCLCGQKEVRLKGSQAAGNTFSQGSVILPSMPELPQNGRSGYRCHCPKAEAIRSFSRDQWSSVRGSLSLRLKQHAKLRNFLGTCC